MRRLKFALNNTLKIRFICNGEWSIDGRASHVAASFHSCRAAAHGALDMQVAVGCKHHHVFDDAALCFDLVRLEAERK